MDLAAALTTLTAALTTAITLTPQSRRTRNLPLLTPPQPAPSDQSQQGRQPPTERRRAPTPGSAAPTPTAGSAPPAHRPLATLTPAQQAAIITALRAELAAATKAADRKAADANLLFFTAASCPAS